MLLATDASLVTESAKDSMVEVLDHLQSLVNEEMTKRSTDLKRRRNREHAPIYRLPHEVFVDIMLAATHIRLEHYGRFHPHEGFQGLVRRRGSVPSYLVTAGRGYKTATGNHDNDKDASWARGSSVRPEPEVGSR